MLRNQCFSRFHGIQDFLLAVTFLPTRIFIELLCQLLKMETEKAIYIVRHKCFFCFFVFLCVLAYDQDTKKYFLPLIEVLYFFFSVDAEQCLFTL